MKRYLNLSRIVSRRAYRVLATDSVDDVCVAYFRERGHHVDFTPTLPADKLREVISNYEGLVVRSATKVDSTLLSVASKLKIVGRAGVGVDNIDVAEATKNGVLVMNTPDGNTISTAQLTLSMLCSLARHIPAANQSVKEGKWSKKSLTGVELAGKTIGIIGCGRIGQVVASYARQLGMTVLGFDPVTSADQLQEMQITPADLPQIWAKSDVISVHTPLNAATKSLLNSDTISKCKKGVLLVNCARGGIVDEAALLAALESGHVGGAALDVFTSEPPGKEMSALLAHPKVVCTPHLGASTEEAQVKVAKDIAVQMCNAFDGSSFVGVVNVPYVAISSHPLLQPFIRLAESIGSIQAQLSPSKVVSVILRTWGGREISVATKNVQMLLEAAVLKGITSRMALSPGAKLPDLVSSPLLARSLGISYKISKELPATVDVNRSPVSPYWNLLTVDVVREDGSTSQLTGSVFGHVPHLLQVDQYTEMVALPSDCQHLLAFRNEDRPGAVSEVLDVLARDKVNVASVNLARSSHNVSEAAPMAMCFMTVDSAVSQQAISELIQLKSLQQVAKIRL